MPDEASFEDLIQRSMFPAGRDVVHCFSLMRADDSMVDQLAGPFSLALVDELSAWARTPVVEYIDIWAGTTHLGSFYYDPATA